MEGFFKLNKKAKIFNIIQLILILTVLLGVKSSETERTDEDSKIFDEVISYKIKNIEGIQKLLEETDMTYLTYYYKKTSKNSRLGADLLKRVSKKLNYLANILMIDCDEVEPKDNPGCQKDPEAADGFPKMEVFSPPEYKFNPYTKKMNSHIRRLYDSQEVSENLIYNFITKNIPSRAVRLSPENFENFANNYEFNKVILFTDKSKTPLLFRGLSNFFYDRLIFGEVEKDQTALIKKFKIVHYPTLMLYQTIEDEVHLDEPKIELYEGGINAEEIVNFLSSAAREQPLRLEKSKDNESQKYKNTFKTLKTSELSNHLKKFGEKRYVVYLNNKDQIPSDIIKFNVYTNGFFHFININCKLDAEAESICKQTFKTNEFPSLLLYNNKEKNITKAMEKPGVVLPSEYSAIVKEVYSLYDGNLKEGNHQTFKALTNESKIKKKIPFVYLHEGEVPLGLYLLSTEEKYLKYIDFIVYEHPAQEFLHNLKIKTLPQLIVLLFTDESSDQARILTYNEDLVYFRLSNFINQYFNTDRNTKVNNEVEEEKKDIPFISNQAALNKYCFKGKKICILGFLDARVNKDSSKQFENSIKTLESVELSLRQKGRPASFGWVNATCHSDFSSHLNINVESLPNLIVYVPSKNLYTSLIGTFEQETIVNFVDKVIQGKVSMNTIEKEKMNMTERNCEDIKEKGDSDEDDELLKQIIEEEKKKREQFDKERNEEETGKKKKKKKKKSDL